MAAYSEVNRKNSDVKLAVRSAPAQAEKKTKAPSASAARRESGSEKGILQGEKKYTS
jgi:hypothetical protein